MTTTQLITKARNGKVNGATRRNQPSPGNPPFLLALPRTDRSRIQWPTEKQLQAVSKQLTRICREGRRCERAGDYFNSGDTAFQLQEIIRATAQLHGKSLRTKP